MRTRPAGYSALQISLHWVIAAIIFFQLVFGEAMTRVVDAAEEGQQAAASDLLVSSLHYWAGIAILVLVALRFGLRLTVGAPAEPPGTAAWMVWSARVVHWLFYGLLVAVPVLGLLTVYVSDAFGDIHALAKPAFIILILVHAGAALFHQLVLRDGTLMRMLRPAH